MSRKVSRASKRPLRRGEIIISEFSMDKDKFDAAPDEQKRLYLALGQITNEITMLQSLTKQGFNGMRGERAVKEIAFGMGLLMLRMLCGRLYEAHLIISKPKNIAIFDDLCRNITDEGGKINVAEAEASRGKLIKYFSQEGPLLNKIRNKLAFHLDEKTLLEGYRLMGDDHWPVVDFHSTMRGSTFFGGCDTAATTAISHLMGAKGAHEGVEAMLGESMDAARAVSNVAEAFLLAFVITHLGEDGYQKGRSIILKDVPDFDHAKLQYFLTFSTATRARYAKDQKEY